MTFLLAWAALRRHPFSFAMTALLATLSASLVGAPVPLVLPAWALASLASLKLWRTLERFVLRWKGCRAPNRFERERLAMVPVCPEIEVLVIDQDAPWLRPGVRSLLISRGLFDLLEDRALVGLISQATKQVPSPSLAAEIGVWIGNLPMLGAWVLSTWFAKLGNLPAFAVGAALGVPLVHGWVGFTSWASRVFGVAIVTLCGAVLVSSGLAAAGLGLLLGWAMVPGLERLLTWEARRAERSADDATVAAGLGWNLVEALETLVWAEGMPTPAGVLGQLQRRGAPLSERADRVWRVLSQT